MATSLTLFFIVEPPSYQYMACYLAASIRKHMPPEVQLVGYCPEQRQDEIDPDVIETLRRMGCEVRGFQTEGKFDPAYPHGNKILAAQIEKYSDVQGVIEDYENTISLMEQDQASVTGERDALQTQVDELLSNQQEIEAELEHLRQGSLTLEDMLMWLGRYWFVIAGVSLLLLLIGLVIGKTLVEAQVKKRFQGVKVW